MKQQLFNILKQVDSSNNYAMGKVHEGLAKNGMAWFAYEQTSGKGQRGKIWKSLTGENIILSVAVEPSGVFEISKFYFNALVSLTVRNFIQELVEEKVYIKWPNDIYICDKKAGGILIENIVNSISWKWSVVGIGLNINQKEFENDLENAISIFQINHKKANVINIAQKLHVKIVEEIKSFSAENETDILEEYNSFLYKKGVKTALKDSSGIFSATIINVNAEGNLIVKRENYTAYRFGEIEWLKDTV